MTTTIKQGHELYGHAQYADVRITATKAEYGRYRKAGLTHRASVQRVADSTGYDIHAICSMVAKRKVTCLKANRIHAEHGYYLSKICPETIDLVRKCWEECMSVSSTKSRHFVMLDVQDRTRYSEDFIEECLKVEKQLTLF